MRSKVGFAMDASLAEADGAASVTPRTRAQRTASRMM